MPSIVIGPDVYQVSEAEWEGKRSLYRKQEKGSAAEIPDQHPVVQHVLKLQGWLHKHPHKRRLLGKTREQRVAFDEAQRHSLELHCLRHRGCSVAELSSGVLGFEIRRFAADWLSAAQTQAFGEDTAADEVA